MKVTFNPQMKLLWNWDRVNDWLKTGDNVPVLIEISPTNYCNAKCPWCFYGGTHSGDGINKDVMLRTLSDMASMGIKAISWTGGGEPTLHPNINEFNETAHKLGFSQGLFTNALSYEKNRINPEFYDWIRISLTEKFMDGIDRKLLKEYTSSKTPIGICLNVTEESYPKAYEYAKQAKELGVYYFQVRPALAKTYDKQKNLEIPYKLKELEDENFKIILSEYKFEDATKPRTYDTCYGHNFCPVIDFRGDVNVCMYKLGKEPYIFGNLNEHSFLDIWKSDKRKKIKACKLVDNDCQVCCKDHEINKLLYHIKHPDRESNIDFI
ncbi:MAG: hypothetical protein CMI53_03330 [Parcubacteria group bacterium]|nr:hypothetical protein [Parcubacteria group bacterium]|tara:strand:+ start:9171 stop:10139 length:969 start_codon:yes stop_codon:yes gene_type:complete